MRKRNIQIITRLNREEHQHLSKLVKKSGLSQSTYLRHLINGVVPQDAPPPDYYGMMAELRKIGTALDRVAQQAETRGLLDAARYNAEVDELNRAILQIADAVLMPRRRQKGSPQSPLCGGEEQPRSGESFAACGESDKRRAL